MLAASKYRQTERSWLPSCPVTVRKFRSMVSATVPARTVTPRRASSASVSATAFLNAFVFLMAAILHIRALYRTGSCLRLGPFGIFTESNA
ncbi:hypothetical protein EDE04_0007 [Streptomyces sp. 2132.2]|nr:hypothetical protein EDE04_0007 [Streptomyces sp. 2132.2]